MFVVHTVSELEEALKENANEIMVTGELAGSVLATYQRKTNNNDVVPVLDPVIEEIITDINAIFEMNKLPAWEKDSMLPMMGNYTAMAVITGNHHFPSAILQRNERH